MAINPKIKQKAEDIRKKIFGSEVRESLASGIEAISEDVEATIGRQGYVEEQFQDVLDETTGKDVISAPELIAARNGKSNLKTRLDDEHAQVTAQLQQTEQELSSQLAETAKYKSILKHGAVGDGLTNNNQAFLDTIATLEDGDTLLIPKGKFLVSQGFVINKNVNIICYGQVIVVGASANTTVFLHTGIELSNMNISSISTDVNGNSIIVAVGDYTSHIGKQIYMYSSTETNPNLRYNDGVYGEGEAAKRDNVKILNVSFDGTSSVMTTGKLMNTYTSLSNIVAKLIKPLEKVFVDGLYIKGTANCYALYQAQYVLNSSFKNFTLDGFDAFAFRYVASNDNYAEGIFVKNPLGGTDGGHGYGYTMSAASHRNKLLKGNGEGVRHFFNPEHGSSYNTIDDSYIINTPNYAIMLGHSGGGELYNKALNNKIFDCHGGVYDDYPSTGTTEGNFIKNVNLGITANGGNEKLSIKDNTIYAKETGINLKGCTQSKANFNKIYCDGLALKFSQLTQNKTTKVSENCDTRFNYYGFYLDNVSEISRSRGSLNLYPYSYAFTGNNHKIGEVKTIELEFDLANVNNDVAKNPVIGFIKKNCYLVGIEYYLDGNVPPGDTIQIGLYDYSNALKSSFSLKYSNVPVMSTSATLNVLYTTVDCVIKPYFAHTYVGTGKVMAKLFYSELPENTWIE